MVCAVGDSNDDEIISNKGRATPSRREAEALRRQQMKTPLTRKERMLRERKAREELRAKQREALNTGRGDFLPPRDRGPVKAMTRDFVDRRRNVAEYMLPLLVVILLVSVFGGTTGALVVAVLWAVAVVGTLLDEIVMVRGLRKQLRSRFEPAQTKGATFYAILRTTQLRRFRLPKPVVQRGDPLRDRY